MFPNAHSQVDYNSDGEVLGWTNESSFEPEYCDTCGVNHAGDCPPEPEEEEDDDEDLGS